LSTYLNALRDAGLEAERFVEPPALVPTYLLAVSSLVTGSLLGAAVTQLSC
jgi:hypothetical protein